MMNQYAVFYGAVRYEFLMQIRRRSVWITFLFLAAFVVTIFLRRPDVTGLKAIILGSHPLAYGLAYWSRTIDSFLPLGFGCLLADRLVRDRRTKVDELFTTLPSGLSARLLGKYAGSTLATLVPFFVFYLMGVGVIIFFTHNLLVLPVALLTFVTICLPGLLFVSAFSLACPLIMWVPLYQFCFIGYWFWGNDLGVRNGIPTLSSTILTPDGKFIASGFYGWEQEFFPATAMTASASMLLLLGIAALVLFVLYYVIRWQQARQ
ncbi:MAG TPA: hypothetical protein VFB60_26050 [Ktedonobacteraceae bacterium]|nr:hypothetical protein [Ktedonobacteraceae bacterium]